MNLDDLRDALRQPPPEPLTVDVERVLHRGRRRAAARRAAVPVLAGLATLAVAVPIVFAGNRPAEVETVGGRSASVTAPPPTSARPAPTTTPPTPVATRHRIAVPASAYRYVLIPTGEKVGPLMRYFQFLPVDDVPGVRFELGAAYSDDGYTTIRSHYPPGSDDSPGFHAATYAQPGRYSPVGGDDWILFGYYVGPATRITVRIDGKPATPRTVGWTGSDQVVVWWLSATSGRSPRPSSAAAVTDLRAYDRDGRLLPAGDAQVRP